MELFNKKDIEDINKKNTNQYYVPAELFDGMQFKLVRLEVKWAYVACLHVILKAPSYDENDNAYVLENSELIIDSLKVLANKKVDNEKIIGYLNELENNELIEKHGDKVFLRRIVNLF